MAAEESLIKHYCTVYRSSDRINFKQWSDNIVKCEFDNLWNPYFPNEAHYHKLDPDFILLADLDEVLNQPCHPDSANCFLWWVSNLKTSSIENLRPIELWRNALKKSYLLVDLKITGLDLSQIEKILTKFNISEPIIQQLRDGRNRRLNRRSFSISNYLFSLLLKFKEARNKKKVTKHLNKVAVNFKNFVPRKME